jgi:hypothetical protein
LESPSTFGAVVAAYSANGYVPTNADRCDNYLGDAGIIVAGSASIGSFSFNVTSNETFVVNILGGYNNPYTLTVTGCDCTPVLNISALSGNKALLDWSTTAGGYKLSAATTLTNTTWTDITNEPIVNAGQFDVTNTLNPTNLFYRLHKP